MKKIFISIFTSILLVTLCSFNIYAEELEYDNVITDETTIEEDFVVLDLELDDYYQPTSYDYDKFYIVAMGESYIENNMIQTYFYVYNPTYQPKYNSLTLEYTLNDVKSSFILDILEYNTHRNLFKMKGFSYLYCEKAIIDVSSIKVTIINTVEDDLNSGESYDVEEVRYDESTFNSINNHFETQDVLSIELSFNSLMIIEEYEAIRVVVAPDNLFWKQLFNDDINSTSIYFYNFNFPDKYKNTDLVYSAVFTYNQIDYEYIFKKDTDITLNPTYSECISRSEVSKQVIKEYNEETTSIDVKEDEVHTLNFPTFYLGNRYTNNQFGDLDLSLYKDNFDYDCSVLLGCEYEKITYPDDTQVIEGINRRDIEMLEIHFRCNGRDYHCQVVSKPVDPEPIYPTEEETLWDKFVRWFKENFPKSLFLCLGIATGVIILAPLLPHIISLLISIITLPFKLFMRIIRRE